MPVAYGAYLVISKLRQKCSLGLGSLLTLEMSTPGLQARRSQFNKVTNVETGK
jgi:hypothetical protein